MSVWINKIDVRVNGSVIIVFFISKFMGGSILMLYKCYIFIIEIFNVVIINNLVIIIKFDSLNSSFLFCEEIVISM